MSTKLKTTKEYIKQAVAKYGNKYDYSNVKYVNSRTKIIIICKKHGEFEIKPLDHLRKECYKCAHNIPTSEEWIENAKSIHGSKYDYSEVVYITSTSEISIICIEHGQFNTIPCNHIKQKYGGCKKCKCCAKKQISIPKINGKQRNRYDIKTYIEACKSIHGNKYDYSNTKYINGDTNVEIICRIHGKFLQRGKSHLQGKGCIKCANKHNYSSEEFIKLAKKVHNDIYDYTKVKYKSSNAKIIIICNIHGEFTQTPNSHLSGRICLKCSNNDSPTTLEWINKAIQVHNNLYDYSKTLYEKNKSKVIIICNKHGEFKQAPSEHLRGSGCIKCSGSYSYTTDEFIDLAKKFVGNYDFSKTKYCNNETRVIITCEKHGDFLKTPNKVLSRKEGCPKCSVGFSKGQIEWLEYLMVDGLYIQHKLNDGEYKIKNSNFHADGYCEKNNIIYEYNGDFWHGNPAIYNSKEINSVTKTTFGYLYTKTIDKQKYCIEQGYMYIGLWENEWKNGINALKQLQKKIKNYSRINL
jgi:hypothetical protein